MARHAQLAVQLRNTAYRPSLWKSTFEEVRRGLNRRVFTMSYAKQPSKPKSRTKALTLVTVAGALSLAAGASVTAVSPAGPMARANRASAITLGEEQISELRVATFYVFDDENTGRDAPGLQFVKEHRHRGTGGRARAVWRLRRWRRAHGRWRARRYVSRYLEGQKRVSD